VKSRGTVAEAREITRIDGLCKTCQGKRLKEIGKTEDELQEYINNKMEDGVTDIASVE